MKRLFAKAMAVGVVGASGAAPHAMGGRGEVVGTFQPVI